MTQVDGFKGFVGYSLRELDTNETNLYCSNNSSRLQQSLPSSPQNRKNFTSDFMLRSYTSGCYYYDTKTGKWSSLGMDLYEDTNLEQTHCLSNHLTAFSGGLVFTPSSINYKYVFANAAIDRNATIYIAVIVAVCLYIAFAIGSSYMDKRDSKKMGIYPLKDNFHSDTYFYELIVFTGNRSESETTSKVTSKKNL
jgi:hypothetical protein